MTTVALSLATWLYLGYIYPQYPQTGFLDWVYRLDGQFTRDFHTDHPPIHWAFAHFLAWLPVSAIGPALLAMWVVGQLLLWGGFVSLCRTVGSTLPTAFAAGLVALTTAFSGFGLAPELLGLTYPTTLAFAISVAGLAALLRSRVVLAGGLLGLATLVHPNLGLLTTAAFIPALFIPADDGLRMTLRRDLPRFALPWAVLGVPSLIAVAKNQVSGGTLSAKQQFDLLTVVRAPHHYLYSHFAGGEYIQTALWTSAFVVGLVVLWRRPPMRKLGLIMVAVVAICGLGAIASYAGKPVALVAAQTSKLSSVAVLLGTVGAAGLLSRCYGGWATPLFSLIFLFAPFASGQIGIPSGVFPVNSLSAVEAALILGLVATALVLTFRLHWNLAGAARQKPAFVIGGASALFVVSAVSLVIKHDDRAIARSPESAAFLDVSAHARHDSLPSTMFLTPPELDGFRTYARRGTVTEFGTIEFGAGDAEWRRRMIAVTGDPATISPAFGSDVIARMQLIESDYTHTVETSRLPICRYGVSRVVARAGLRTPPWLRVVYENDDFELLRVRKGTCRDGQVARSKSGKH